MSRLPPPEAKRKVVVPISIPRWLKEELDSKVKRTYRNRSQVVEASIRQYLRVTELKQGD